MSEYPPGAKTHPSFFRARNRITSGLSVAALVIEAPARSGALLFADEALGQGREVFAVPGNITAPNSAGSNRLIMEGAHPAVSAWDVLAGFTGRFPTLNEAGRVKKPPRDLAEAAVAESAERVKAAEEDGEEAENEPKKAKSPRRGKLRPKKDVDKPEAEEYSDLVKQLEGPQRRTAEDCLRRHGEAHPRRRHHRALRPARRAGARGADDAADKGLCKSGTGKEIFPQYKAEVRTF